MSRKNHEPRRIRGDAWRHEELPNVPGKFAHTADRGRTPLQVQFIKAKGGVVTANSPTRPAKDCHPRRYKAGMRKAAA